MEELKQLIVKLAAVAERLDQRSESAVRRVEATGAALDQRAQGLVSNSSGFTREVSQALREQASAIIGAGVGDSIERFNTQIAGGARLATAAAEALEKERKALARERRTWLVLGSGALLVGSFLAVGSAAYAVASSRKQIERNRIEAELLRAYNEADVSLCGGRLCANVDMQGARSGGGNEYLPVKPRQTR